MTTVAVLGTGIMGAPMARNIAAGGSDVRVWNRTRERAEAIAGDGVEVADTPAEAAAGADVVVTVLTDGEVVDAVIGDDGDPLSALADDGVWLQASTVGSTWTDELAARAEAAGVPFVDGPVLGTKGPAEAGTLKVLVSGPAQAIDRCIPVFEAIGDATYQLGDAPGAASRTKLVINTWIVGLVTALGEAIALAEALDVDPDRFLDIIDGGPLGPPYARVKGDLMVAGGFPASFPLELALKDAELVVAAAEEAGLDPTLTRAVADRMARAVELGHGRDDMAAVVQAYRHR